MKRSTSIDRAAAQWVAERAVGFAHPSARRAFRLWLLASPRHRKAYEEMEEIWRAADALRAYPLGATADKRRRGRKVAGGAAAAVLALFGIFGSEIFLRLEQRTEVRPVEYSTEIGANRTEQLPDGSTASLNTNSSITVLITDKSRIISLLHGEALFQVAHDRNRRFDVVTENHTVRAIGTEFSVRRDHDQQLDVLVVSGQVVIDPPSGKHVPLLSRFYPRGETVRAHERARVLANGIVKKWSLTKDEVERELLWRTGAIRFDGVRLEEAIDEMNRYSRRKVRVVDEQILNTRIGGGFLVTDPAGFVRGISVVFNLREDPSAAHPDEIRLVRAEPKP